MYVSEICNRRDARKLDMRPMRAGEHTFCCLVSLYILSLKICRSGDVELNPGPISDPDISDPLLDSYAKLTNSGISIMHLNIQSLKPKIDLLAVEAQPYEILVFSETWLNHNIQNDDLQIPNFSPPFRCDRRDRIGGGVAIYVRDTIHAVQRQDLLLEGLEALWVEIHVNQRKFLIGGIYRPPNSNNTQWTKMEHSLDQAFGGQYDNILVTGDFNIDTSASPSNKMSRLIASYNAEQLINSPTHITEHSSTLIDLMFVKHPHHIISSFVADPFIPDLIRFHCPIVSVLKFAKPKQTMFKRRIWLYDKGDYAKYQSRLRSINWNSFLINEDLNVIADNFADSIIAAATESIPNKTVTIRPGDVPWMNNEIRKMIRKRNKVHRQAKLHNDEPSWSNFRCIRNETTKLIRKSKAEHQEKIILQINSDNITAKKWFKLAKQLTTKRKSSTIPTLVHNGVEATTAEDKAELLNTFFCMQSTLNDNNHTPPVIPTTVHSSLSDIFISVQDVKDAICLIDPTKASGPDVVSPRLIKEGANELAEPLSLLFNKLITNSVFPACWKQANVSPIFKKSDPSKPSNYRPISLLSCLGKLMERCVHKYLYNYVISNDILTTFQSGFIKGDSTVNQLTYLYNDISKAMDEGKEVRAVFCDISKAFDRVWHRGLLQKLSSIGIQGSLLNWFSSYLSSRKQRVVIANSSSSWSTINAGVPQGSILGPLLFLIYINDIVADIQAKIRLFADDTSLYIIVEDTITSALVLNNDLSRINSWSKSWLVCFNPSKTESVLFSRKRNKPDHPAIFMDQVPIPQVKTHKHLGLTLAEDSKWTSHISSSVNKAWQRIGIFRSLKFVLSRSSLERMYISFIRPLLEYGDVVWDNCSNELKIDLEAVQNEAARIVAGATKLCNLDRLLSELNWESLADRRRKHRLILFFKMKNNLSPLYLSNLIPEHSNQAYSLRSLHNVPLIHTNTQSYGSSFLPLTIREWNTLSSDVRNASTIFEFKGKLHNRPKKSSPLYNIGNRRQQIHHTRLRLGCSSLNYDLNRRNIVDSPLCICGAIETPLHYLIHCPRYDRARQLFFSDLPCAFVINNLLFGDEHLSFESNKFLFLHVQGYIAATKRFDA